MSTEHPPEGDVKGCTSTDQLHAAPEALSSSSKTSMLSKAQLVLVAATVLRFHSTDAYSHLSHTVDSASQVLNAEVCAGSLREQGWQGLFNVTRYTRQPHLELQKHRRALDEDDQSEAANPHARLKSLYEAPILLPTASVQNAVSNLGDTRRLDRFLARLLAGDPVTVVALGGSVTVGHGPELKQDAWLYRVFDWLNTTFPHPEHVFINEAIPAVTSSYVAPCVLSMVPANTDLVLLEFTFNDGERTETPDMQQPTRLGLERLLRKLMRIESRPAILNLHYSPFNIRKSFWDGVEDQMEVVFKYYGVASLSLRNALHRFLREQSWLVDKMWYLRDIHPTCIGSRFIADVVIGFLQDTAAFVLRTDRGPHHDLHREVLWEELVAPMFPGNGADEPEDCTLGDDFRALAGPYMGWEWLDEGRTSDQHKWGFISWNKGESIQLTAPLDRVLPQLGEDRRVLVALGVLMSYEHMGWLQVGCLGGCSCPPREINTQHLMRYSLTYWKSLNVTIDAGSDSCKLHVANIGRPSDGEHKVKLTSLLVSLAHDSFVESWNY